VAVAAAGPDGREVLHDVDPKALGSAYGVILLKRFYVMSGTRLTAMDYAGVMIILGGMAFPVLHGTARFMTRHLRQGTKKPEGRRKA
jgi:acyl-coenzyme A thioesterase PaaI-like protein